jgi:hypothetical protein
MLRARPAAQQPVLHWPACPGRRRILLHAGLHKTGTTALQQFLAGAAGRLREHGILYPAAGRPYIAPDAHHNVAWQLAGDRRFAPQSGGVEELAAEIAGFPGDAILTSEDFESVLGQPERLAPLLRHPALRGHAFTIVFYVREQAAYLESLFLEMLQHGLADPAAAVCERVLAEGELRYEAWTFHFDYAALHRRLRDAAGTAVAVRAYDRLQGGSSISDFLDFARLPVGRLPNDAQQRTHARLDLAASLALFCGHRSGLTLDAAGEILAARLRPLLGDHRAHLSAARRARLAARFGPGNARLAHACGFPQESLDIGLAPPQGPDLEHLFSATVRAALVQAAGIDALAAVMPGLAADAPTGPT